MATGLDKSIVSRLKTALQATPAVDKETIDAFMTLLDEIQQPEVTDKEAEKRLRKWLGSGPSHTATVLPSVVLASVSLRIASEDSWVYQVFRTLPNPAKK